MTERERQEIIEGFHVWKPLYFPDLYLIYAGVKVL